MENNEQKTKSFETFLLDNSVSKINGFASIGSEYIIRIVGHIADGTTHAGYVVQTRPINDGETLFFEVFCNSVKPTKQTGSFDLY